VPGCDPSQTLNPLRASDPWLAYAGGYYIDRPACMSVVVKTDNQAQPVYIGVGVGCDGGM
jgi:hypothetical protein